MNNVIFLNKPKLSEHKVDSDFNDRRIALVPEIDSFLNKHPLFTDKKVEVTFASTGVSSLICILDTNTEKYILKMPLSLIASGLEGIFLKAWEDVGIKVPHVFEEGKIGNHFYTLMEYIDSPTLSQKYTVGELLEKNIYKDLGMLLKKMHTVKSKGYSNIVNEKMEAEYMSVAEWLANDTRMKEQVIYIKENNLLDSNLIDEVYEILKSHIGDNTETVYCHNDFNTGNIFNTDPLTVFDPWSCFHHPYMDIARSIVNASKSNMEEIQNQLLEGYFGNEEYDKQLLQAFIILNIFAKFPYMHKTKKVDVMNNLKRYISETKDTLKRG